MTRTRLAPVGPPTYDVVRNNLTWADHAARTLVTGGLIAWLAPETIVDPACGDASILEAAYRQRRFERAHLYDISEPQITALEPSFPHAKAVADVFTVLHSEITADCIVLTEILEHLEDPDLALRLARRVGTALVASTPIDDPEGGSNPEHLWSWGVDDFELMLGATGWTPLVTTTLVMPGIPGNSQIWVAR